MYRIGRLAVAVLAIGSSGCNLTGNVSTTASGTAPTISSPASTSAPQAPAVLGISNPPPDSASQDAAYQYTPKAARSDLKWTATGLPSGLSIDPATGTISGFPDDMGAFPIQLTGSAPDGSIAASASFTLNVQGDPLAKYQWQYYNSGQTAFAKGAGVSGQDLNARDVIRAGVTGRGVTIAVSDTGVAIAHAGLQKNILKGASRDYSQTPAANEYGGDPTPSGANAAVDDNAHGTAVAGIIGEARWKGTGGHGIAPDAQLAGFNYLLNQGVMGADLDQLTSYEGNLAIDVFNQSWGTDNFQYVPITAQYLAQLKLGTTTYRGGKGAIYVRAGGNGYIASHLEPNGQLVVLANSTFTSFLTQNVNSQQDNANPYVIVVGSLNAAGVRASYSSPGSAIWVSGLGGEFGDTNPAVITTDLPGCAQGFSHDNARAWVTGSTPANGFEWGGTDQKTYNADCDYTSIMNGTSAAAPSVAAGIGLILQANPSLTWRDVAYILGTTAAQVDPNIPDGTCSYDVAGYINQPKWLKNAAGHPFHNFYGFGRPDLKAAVAMAKTYQPTSAILTDTLTDVNLSKSPLAIPNLKAAGVTSTARINIAGNPKIFTVLLHVTSNHPMPAELALELTSPSGTKSVVLSSCNSFVGDSQTGTTLNDAVFRTNAFLDETTNGTWTLRAIDTMDYGTSTAMPTHTGAITDWKLDLYY